MERKTVWNSYTPEAVSYTHLDVYKRQPQGINHPQEVFAAGLDENGQFFWQKKTTRIGG